MSEYKVGYEKFVDELFIRFRSLEIAISDAKRDFAKVFSNLYDIQDRNLNVIDYSTEIQRKYSEGTPLTQRQLKYYWANFKSFDVSLIPWCAQLSPNSSLIESFLIKSWQPSSLGEEHYGSLVAHLEAPSYLPSWLVLSDISKLREFADKEIPKFLTNRDHFDRLPMRAMFFRYMIADYCHRRMDQQSLLTFVNDLEGSHFSALHFDVISDKRSEDVASGLMIAALLKCFRSGKVENAQIHLWLNHTKSFLGDPRALGNKWGFIEQMEPDGYFNWLSSLNEEDILFFFENLEKVIHPERREFWLRFVRSARRIAVVLDADKRTKLLRKYQNNEKMLEIIKRSYQFRSNSSSDQQLIIYFFDEYVFVEGSNTGFACQIFSESVFKQKFKDSFYNSTMQGEDRVIREATYSSFRGNGSGILKALSHVPPSPDWEKRFLNEFSALNIFPDSVGTFGINQSRKDATVRGRSAKSQSMREAKTTSPGKDSTHGSSQVGLNDFMIELARNKAVVIPKNGLAKMWVLYDPELTPIIDRMVKSGFKMRLSMGGGKATQGKMAWYLDD
ncbi:MAG: EH signature domain-containing protein [Bdellovibrio sp.]